MPFFELDLCFILIPPSQYANILYIFTGKFNIIATKYKKPVLNLIWVQTWHILVDKKYSPFHIFLTCKRLGTFGNSAFVVKILSLHRLKPMFLTYPLHISYNGGKLTRHFMFYCIPLQQCKRVFYAKLLFMHMRAMVASKKLLSCILFAQHSLPLYYCELFCLFCIILWNCSHVL